MLKNGASLSNDRWAIANAITCTIVHILSDIDAMTGCPTDR